MGQIVLPAASAALFVLGLAFLVRGPVYNLAVPLPVALLVLPPALVSLLLVAAVPITVGLAAVVDRMLARRRPRPARRAGSSTRVQKVKRKKLLFTTEAAWSVVQLRSLWSSAAAGGPAQPALHARMPEALVASVDALLSLIMRDFILSWFVRISPSSAFPHELERTIREALAALVVRAEKADLASLVVGRLVPRLTAHLDAFSAAKRTLSGSRRQSTFLGDAQAEGFDLFLVQSYGSNLHPAISGTAVDSRPAQEAHLRALVAGILELVLPERNRSEVVDVIAREIVTCTVLMPVVEMLADPDFWNRLLDEQATKHIHEQKLITQLRAALDTTMIAPSPSSPSPSSADPPPIGTSSLPHRPPRARAASVASSRRAISSRTDARAFASFVRGIDRLEVGLDVRRLRSDVEREIRRAKELLGTSAAGGTIPTGETPPDLRAHLERLIHAHSRIERRLAQLNGNESQLAPKLSHASPSSSLSSASLQAVLTDPSSLSYFMEFAERKGAVLPVQFWLMVESFRSPLEDLDLASGADDDDEEREDGGAEEDERVSVAKDDLRLIWESYFEEDVLGHGIGERYGPPIEAFLRGQGKKGMLSARRSMFNAQRHIYTILNDDFFPLFRHSDLYFKAIANAPAPLVAPAAAAASAVPRVVVPQPPAFLHRATVSGSDTSKDRHVGASSTSLDLSAGKASAAAAPLASFLDSASASPPLASPPLNSPRLKSSHFDFLISTDTDGPGRPPLFVEPDDADDSEEDDNFVQVRRMDAIQAALTDIIAKDESVAPAAVPSASRRRSMQPAAQGRRLPSDSSMARSVDSLLYQTPSVGSPSHEDVGASTAGPPAAAAQHAPPRRPSKRVFDDDSDDDDGATTPSLLSSLLDDQGETETRDVTPVSILQLPSGIERVTVRIAKLRSQEALLDALVRKAELAGSKRELALLCNSQNALAREVRALTFQQRQWEQQERDSRLYPGRTKVSIPSVTSLTEDEKPITRYLIEVQQLGEDGAFAHGWVTARRYNEFFSLHHDMREKLASVRHLALPGKMLVTSMSSSFVDSRRAGLEKYLQSLITIPDACASLELRAFLSQASSSPNSEPAPGQAKSGPSLPRPHDLVKSLYRTVTSGLDDISAAGTTGADSIFDLLSQGLTKQAGDLAVLAGFAPSGGPASAGALANPLSTNTPGLSDLMGLKPIDDETASSYFTAPICDLFVEVFELKENNWLRRQAIVIILQQILGTTIERKLRDVIDRLTSPSSILGILTSFSNSMWPDGIRRPPTVMRTDEEKRLTKDAAAKKLPSLIPDIASNMIGRSNTRRGAKRLFAVVQHQKLNQSIVHTILDELIYTLFPELKKPGL